MHFSGFELDLNWFLQFIVTAFIIAFGLLHLVKNTASKYFVVDANFDSSLDSPPPSSSLGRDDRQSKRMPDVIGPCVVCGNSTTKQCAGCKLVKYCSQACQGSHWKSGHKLKCKDFQLSGKSVSGQSASVLRGRGASTADSSAPADNVPTQTKRILFPYEEFIELYNWDKPDSPPCGLLNCGNSCFANVVLQCLAYTRPLAVYLLEKGHRTSCRRNDWCFLCEFQTHLEKTRQSVHPFSPINILSRLPNIGGNLGYGKQEDAHEFMRFAIDTMQSVCLDEFGGEKVVHPSSQETTLIQHIFGGQLQSQVICTKCKNVSNQFENMMDLTVEIHGDAASLEECLDQFTAKEWLDGDNKYKCDGCNDYVLAWKRLTVRWAPNILTIALKRFQSGRFGKLNKRVTFPETLDLSPYMSEAGDGNDIYKLYAVVVHVDMLNASFFGHYICYTKDSRGNWYRIDDCKVVNVELDEVLSQGAYMLLYRRICPRSSCLNPLESPKEAQDNAKPTIEVEPCPTGPVECSSPEESDSIASFTVSSSEEEPSPINDTDCIKDVVVESEASSSLLKNSISSNSGEETAEHSCHQLVSGSTSTEAYLMNEETPSLVSTIDNPSSMPSENHVLFEEDGSSHKVVDGLNSVNPTAKPETKTESLTSSPSVIAGDASRVKPAGAKLKPLFTPGFLSKRPRNKSPKQDGEILIDHNTGNQSNGFVESDLCHVQTMVEDGEASVQNENDSDIPMISSDQLVVEPEPKYSELAETSSLCRKAGMRSV